MDLFILLLGFFFAFFLVAYATKEHGIGIIMGIYLFVLGILSYTDPLEYKVGMVFSGTNQSIVTYTNTEIGGTWIGLIGLVLIGISIVVMYKEALSIGKGK